MSWNRRHLGFVKFRGVVHYLYERWKWERVHWDTQCGIQWEDRNNFDRTRRPRGTRAAPTCLACVEYERRVRSGECVEFEYIVR